MPPLLPPAVEISIFNPRSARRICAASATGALTTGEPAMRRVSAACTTEQHRRLHAPMAAREKHLIISIRLLLRPVAHARSRAELYGQQQTSPSSPSQH